MLLLSSYLINFFFMKVTFIFSCSGMFRHVWACSGMFRVPGFIDAPQILAFVYWICRKLFCMYVSSAVPLFQT